MSDQHSSPQPSPESTSQPPLVWAAFDELRGRLAESPGLLFGTDFDGTLSPIADDPDTPEPTDPNLRSLRTFRDHPQVRPAVISGRGLADLRDRLGLSAVDCVGNHGLELGIDGSRETHPEAASAEPAVETVCHKLAGRLGDIEGTLIENKGVTATIHYRQADRTSVGEIESRLREAVAEYGEGELEIHDGKESFELRPAADWDKGSALSQLREAVDESWMSFYIGDDTTDEAAFRAVGDDGITVHVGDNEQTAAAYRVRNSTEAEVFSRGLATDGLAVLSADGSLASTPTDEDAKM